MDREKLIELVKAAQAGDDAAMQALYTDGAKRVFYVANQNLHDAHAAEDMVQEVFFTVTEKIGTLREPAAFYRWLTLITVRKCTDEYRKRRDVLADTEHDDGLFDIEDIDTGIQPGVILDNAETRRMIVEVIDKLPPPQRICIYYYYFEQLTIKQISEVLEVGESAVKKRLAVAREKIKEAILQKEKDEGIKLYAAPLALTPILRMALDEYTMPEGVLERVWQNIAQARGAGGGAGGTGGSAGNATDGTDGPAGGGAQDGSAQGQGPADSDNGPAQADSTPGQPTEPGPDTLRRQGSAAEPPQAQPDTTGIEGQAPDAPGPDDTAQPDKPKGEPSMDNQPGNNQPQQPSQYPQQGQQPQYPQGQPQQGYPQGQQPYTAQPQGQPCNAAPNAAPPTPPPAAGASAAQGAAQAAGTGAAKAGMALGTKIAIAAVAVVAAAGLAVTGAVLIPRLLNPSDDGGVSTIPDSDVSFAQSTSLVASDDTGSQVASGIEGFAIIGAPIQDGFAEEHEVTLVVDGKEYTGTYEGEYASGLFNGYGVWVSGGEYWVYEGYWDNGLPNGEGTLTGSNGEQTEIYVGTFVDGFAHGSITYTVEAGGQTNVWVYDVDMGLSTESSIVNEQGMALALNAIVGVPPWGMNPRG